MRMTPLFFTTLATLFTACGPSGSSPDPDGGGPLDAPSAASCTVTANTTSQSGPVIVRGSGAVVCPSSTSLRIETCLQWETSGGFTDVQCQSESASGVTMLMRNVEVGCISPRTFRTRVRAEANGAALPEQLSAVHAAPCR